MSRPLPVISVLPCYDSDNSNPESVDVIPRHGGEVKFIFGNGREIVISDVDFGLIELARQHIKANQ